MENNTPKIPHINLKQFLVETVGVKKILDWLSIDFGSEEVQHYLLQIFLKKTVIQ